MPSRLRVSYLCPRNGHVYYGAKAVARQEANIAARVGATAYKGFITATKPPSSLYAKMTWLEACLGSGGGRVSGWRERRSRRATDYKKNLQFTQGRPPRRERRVVRPPQAAVAVGAAPRRVNGILRYVNAHGEIAYEPQRDIEVPNGLPNRNRVEPPRPPQPVRVGIFRGL